MAMIEAEEDGRHPSNVNDDAEIARPEVQRPARCHRRLGKMLGATNHVRLQSHQGRAISEATRQCRGGGGCGGGGFLSLLLRWGGSVGGGGGVGWWGGGG